MFINRQLQDEAIAAVGIVDTPEALARIRRPEMAGVIWYRDPADGFQGWIDNLPEDTLPSCRVILRPHAIRNAVDAACEAAGTPSCPHRNLLAEDVAQLGAICARVLKSPYLRLRLDVVTGNACRRFHTDAVRARMICTYRGAGTQYGIGQNGEDPRNPLQVPTGSPLLLRGNLWPEIPKSGVLHRSPPIEGTGETRLLLVFDPVEDPLAEEEL